MEREHGARNYDPSPWLSPAARASGSPTPRASATSMRYSDADALRAAIDDDTVAFLVEPVQGEAGIILPPPGYLTAVREICDEARMFLVADENQSGLGRTGRRFACDHEGVVADVVLLGTALGGGILPLSAVVADAAVLGVIGPGQHGSTFGGNPLACAVGLAVLALLIVSP